MSYGLLAHITEIIKMNEHHYLNHIMYQMGRNVR